MATIICYPFKKDAHRRLMVDNRLRALSPMATAPCADTSAKDTEIVAALRKDPR